MKALSIRQPWAWAILHAGKDVENRDWKPTNPGLKFRGRFLIHTGKGMTRAEYDEFEDTAFMAWLDGKCSAKGVPAFDDLPRGGIVGMAEIVGVMRDYVSPWFCGPYGLVLKNAAPLPFIPLNGALGFFDVPADVVTAVEKARAG